MRYLQLDSQTPVLLSNSGSLGAGNRRSNTTGLNFANSNYAILENIKSGVGEWNSILGSNMANSLIVGYTKNDESRPQSGRALPDGGHPRGRHGLHHLRLRALHAQRTSSATTPSRCRTTSPGAARSTRSPSAGPSSATTPTTCSSPAPRAPTSTTRSPTSTPTRTTTSRTRTGPTSPVTLAIFQVRWNNIPGQTEPLQPLDVWYGGLYAPGRVAGRPQPQGDLRPARRRVVLRRHRLPRTPTPTRSTFRDAAGNPVQYQTGQAARRQAALVAAPGLQLGRERQPHDPGARRHGPLHGPPALRVDLQPGRQHRRAHRLRGRSQHEGCGRSTRTRTPTSPRASPARRPPSYELALTDPDFKFPQVWRSNIARRPAAALGPDRHGRVHLQQGRERHLVHQRQPARGADELRRAPTRVRAGRTTGSTPTSPNTTVLGNQNDGLLLARLGLAHEAVHRPGLPEGRLQLRRVEEHDRPRARSPSAPGPATRSRAIPTTRRSPTRTSSRATACSSPAATASST